MEMRKLLSIRNASARDWLEGLGWLEGPGFSISGGGRSVATHQSETTNQSIRLVAVEGVGLGRAVHCSLVVWVAIRVVTVLIGG